MSTPAPQLMAGRRKWRFSLSLQKQHSSRHLEASARVQRGDCDVDFSQGQPQSSAEPPPMPAAAALPKAHAAVRAACRSRAATTSSVKEALPSAQPSPTVVVRASEPQPAVTAPTVGSASTASLSSSSPSSSWTSPSSSASSSSSSSAAAGLVSPPSLQPSGSSAAAATLLSDELREIVDACHAFVSGWPAWEAHALLVLNVPRSVLFVQEVGMTCLPKWWGVGLGRMCPLTGSPAHFASKLSGKR